MQAAELFCNQWCRDLEPHLARLASEATLCNYLMDADWGLVAELGGRIMGVCLASCGLQTDKARTSWLARREALVAEVGPGAQFGREVAPVEAEEGKLACHYAARKSIDAGTEIKLLVVSPASRGMGVGKRLVQASADHVREVGHRGFFLITDDTCDVGFYDHLGLSRQLEEPSRAEPGLNLYVYSKELG